LPARRHLPVPIPYDALWDSKVRIVLVGTSYPLRGGIAHFTTLLFKKLQERGHEVQILSFKRLYPKLFFPGKTQKDEGDELIPVRSTPLLDSINPISWIRAFFWIRSMRPDFLIFNYWMPFFAPCYATLVFFVANILKIPSLYILHNVIPHEKRIGDRFLSWLSLRFVNSFIALSQSVFNDLFHIRADAKVLQIPHPVYDIFPQAISMKKARTILKICEGKVLLYFGYIRAYKGLKFLIQAMSLITKKLKVRLLICGEFYEGKKEITSLIQRLELGKSISLIDQFIPNEDVSLYFCAANLVVLPYVTATQSGIIQIAYNYNKPVVATHVGGLSEVVIPNKTGYLIEPENPKAIAEAVTDFFLNKNELAFSRYIRKEKLKYSWDYMVDAIEKLSLDPIKLG